MKLTNDEMKKLSIAAFTFFVFGLIVGYIVFLPFQAHASQADIITEISCTPTPEMTPDMTPTTIPSDTPSLTPTPTAGVSATPTPQVSSASVDLPSAPPDTGRAQ